MRKQKPNNVDKTVNEYLDLAVLSDQLSTRLSSGMLSENTDVSSVTREYGRPRSFCIPNHVQIYLKAWPNFPDPSVISIDIAGKVDYAPVAQHLIDAGWRIDWMSSQYKLKEMERPNTVIMTNPGMPGYMLEFTLNWSQPAQKRKKNYKKIKNYEIAGTLKKFKSYKMNEGDRVKIDDAWVFSPAKTDQLWNPQFIADFTSTLEKNMVAVQKVDAEVSIIVVANGDYNIRSFSLEDANTSFLNPDLHYGDGFEDFHHSMLKRVDLESKGLILFHGQPGTGKTQYIRHLLKELCKANKAVLYSPPAVSASLAEPQMINFISDWIMEEKRDCILLIEDAEPLLESRNGGADGRSTGISNLLNITDGILNDILGLMVIATFNIDISRIDSALLRPGRLIARKEFKKISKESAEKLATSLKIDLPEITYPATLADFYNSQMAKKIILHNYTDNSNNKIGFTR